MKVAIVHYWLVGMRGGEKVLEQLCELYPEADIYTHVYDPEKISARIKRHRIFTTNISRLPFAKKLYQAYLPFMPMALEELDLTDYDLVISSESGPAKGIITNPYAKHICYCHSPMRYIWDEYYNYRQEIGFAKRLLFSFVAHNMRQWDVSSASRVDRFIANSNYVRKRIHRYYNRQADVVHPPVDLENFHYSGEAAKDFYLVAGQLVGYKRVDLAVEAFARNGKKLLVAGNGSLLNSLKKNAPDNVKFLGYVSNDELHALYRDCKALVFPGCEDFGIVPLEAMASGRPVIAYQRGGVMDTVVPGLTGVLFEEQTADSLCEAIERFEAQADRFIPEKIVHWARNFSENAFRDNIAHLIAEELASEAAVEAQPEKSFYDNNVTSLPSRMSAE